MLFNCKKFFIDLKNCCKTRDTDLKFFNYFNHLCDSFFNNTNIVNVKPFLNLDKQLDNFSTINILLNELHKMYKQKVDIDINTNIEKENILYKAYDFWKSSHINEYSLVKNLFYGVVYKTVKCETCPMKESFENFFYITINDFDIISELTTFVSKNNSFEGEVGTNDDLCMTLVIFSWLIVQDYFKEMTNNDVRKRIYEEQKDQIEQDMSPFGFINDGILSENEEFLEKETGDYWLLANDKNTTPLEVWNLDEYGDISYMWDYR